jgi:O-Antigen ligase
MQTAPLTVGIVVRQTAVLILLIGIACSPVLGREIALCILIVMACRDPAWALKSLAAGTVITCVSSPLVGGPEEASVLISVLKWLLLFVACGRSLLSRVEPTEAYTRLSTYWFVITAVLLSNSVFVSPLPVISVFKTISFSLGLLCVLRLATLTWDRNEEMLLFFAELGFAVVATSVPLLAFGGGYSRNEYGFNGILNQPQALGVLLVMTGAATFAIAFKTPRMARLLIALGIAQWTLIFLTGARTALVAIIVGGVVYLFETVVRGGQESRIRHLSLPGVAIAITGLVLIVTVFPAVGERFGAFVQKGDAQSFGNNPELALNQSSRGDQISDGLELAGEHPVFGYGFGVDPSSQSNMDAYGAQLGGIPLSAPVEQGFLPLATVAQIGMVGSLFVFAFLLAIYRFARADSGETSALFAAVVGVNLGEMIFYSVGGLGILMWILLSIFTAGGAFPQQRVRELER